MYTRVAAWATSATPLPMWGVEGSGMVLLPNMVTDFRDTFSRGSSPFSVIHVFFSVCRNLADRVISSSRLRTMIDWDIGSDE
jgi:hypothetical protein